MLSRTYAKKSEFRPLCNSSTANENKDISNPPNFLRKQAMV